jgi:membrane protein YdbS with pleckstrin-like domain
MKSWGWQKWIGKLLVLAIAVAEAIWVLIEGTPGWWLPIMTGATWAVQFIIGLFPPKV